MFAILASLPRTEVPTVIASPGSEVSAHNRRSAVLLETVLRDEDCRVFGTCDQRVVLCKFLCQHKSPTSRPHEVNLQCSKRSFLPTVFIFVVRRNFGPDRSFSWMAGVAGLFDVINGTNTMFESVLASRDVRAERRPANRDVPWVVLSASWIPSHKSDACPSSRSRSLPALISGPPVYGTQKRRTR